MNTTEEQLDLFEQYVSDTNRFEKMEWLQESCTPDHITHQLLPELVNWLGENDFNEFFERHCRLWDIKCPEELNQMAE